MDLLAASVADFEYREALQDLESFLADRYFGGESRSRRTPETRSRGGTR